MSMLVIAASRLNLVLASTEATLARIEALSPADRAQVSPDWLAQLQSGPPSPWTHGFAMVTRADSATVGSCAYKGPPDPDGAVEIAYEVNPEYRGRGFAKEAAAALVTYARDAGVRSVRAHTLPERNASTSVLTACGFAHLGDVVDPDDGPVWRWELAFRD